MTRTTSIFGVLTLVCLLSSPWTWSACSLETRPMDVELGGTGGAGRGGAGGRGGASAVGGGGAGAAGSVAEGGSGGVSGAGRGGGPAAGGGGQAGEPAPNKRDDGGPCRTNEECASDHCSQGLCCASGDCCTEVADCPRIMDEDVQLACNDPSECQGSGGRVVCAEFRCMVDGGNPNDSACTSQHQAKDCWPYKPVFCNGQADQQPPQCDTSCQSDDACADEAHCDGQVCVRDAAPGGNCVMDKDCSTGHCSNSICCATGDCCVTTEVCRDYASAPTCTDVATCTGSYTDAFCSEFQCQSRVVADNAACVGMRAADCGLYVDVICADRTTAPACPDSCTDSNQCKPTAYCDLSGPGPGTCRQVHRDGERCTDREQCEVACNNGVCCRDTGPNALCCADDRDCESLEASGCVSATSCDGVETTGTCNRSSFTCSARTMPSNTACTQEIDCGPGYASRLRCSANLRECGCTNQMACADGYVCMMTPPQRGVCVPAPEGMGGMGGSGNAGAGGSD
ncbi:MAG: hypothetical protein ABW321_33645 [Polyangiales bacterium]